MKNKIITYSIFLIIGILLGAGGYYLTSGSYAKGTHTHTDGEGQLYTCGMHPDIIETEPGNCPICGMKLNPIKGENKSSAKPSGERKIIYWRAPMNPNEVYDEPGKSQMGMDLVPVYEDEEGASGVVTVDGSTQQSMNVKMEFVQSRELSSIIYTNGTLETDERREFALTTKINGWIDKLYINYIGQKVEQGQKLVDIYSPKLVAAQQEIITALNFENSLNTSDNSLLKNAVRKLELFDISKSEIEKLIKSKKIKKYITLYAPFGGTVLKKNVLEGEMIKAGKEILKISDLSNLWLKADIYESELNKVKIGAKVEARFSYNPNKTYDGKVTFIYPTVDPRTRTVTVRIDVVNNNNELKPSMFANVTIKGEKISNSPTIPETAIIRSGKKNRVILSLGKGKFKPVEVKLGLYSDGYYQILSGLKEGDAIVSSGQFMIDSESSLRSAVRLFSSTKEDIAKKSKMNEEEMKTVDTSKNVSKEVHNHSESDSIVHKGIINIKAIDKNGDGKVYECPMDWNVISDEKGRCPVCNMFLKEYTIDETKINLKENGFEYK